MQVWKYPIEMTIQFKVSMPAGAQILHVACQFPNQPYMWVLVNTENHRELRLFLVRGTGQEDIPEGTRHHGTFFLDGGRFVFHLFER